MPHSDPCASLGRRWRWFGVACAIVAGCDQPAPEAPAVAGARPVLLIVTSREEADGATAAEVISVAERLGATVSGLELLAGGELGRRLQRDPSVAISECGASLTCIAGLGRAAGAHEVVFGRVRGQEGGATIQFLTLRTDREEIGRGVELQVESLGELEPKLREQFAAIFGAELPAAAAVPETPAAAQQKPLARCLAARGGVQVRRADALTWEPLREGAALGEGDLVRTPPGATAELGTRWGSRFEVAPGSLVAMEAEGPAGDDGKPLERVAVRAGTVRGMMSAGGGRVAVRTPDGEESLLSAAAGQGPMRYRIAVRKDQSVEVAVGEGRGQLTTSQGEKVELAAGKAQDLRFGALAGEAVALPDFPRLLAPGIDAPVMRTKDISVAMKWKDAGSDVTYRLQVAQDQSFRALVVDKICPLPSFDFVPPAEGTYHWRVATRDVRGREGEFGFAWRLYITPERVPDLLVSPIDNTVVNLAREYMGFITFSWRAAVPPAPYVLIVSTDPKLEKGEPAMTVTTTAQEVMTRQLDAGDYFWGVFVKRSGELKPIFIRPRRLRVGGK